ncbi:MAG: hypothetical protein ACPIC3_02720 [Candidatus Puniceispirillaceae bacterium]
MRHSALQPATLVGAFLLVVFVSGLATTSTLCRQMALSQTNMPTDIAAPVPGDGPSGIDLKTVSPGALLGVSLRLILP